MATAVKGHDRPALPTGGFQPVGSAAADADFFSEWNSRDAGTRRSRERAAALLATLDLTHLPQIVTVVGSKGKGTTAIYASAYLAAAGYRALTVTSPPLCSPTERIRVDGAAITPAELSSLGRRLRRHLARLPQRRSSDGYASPSGLFIMAGLVHAARIRADVVVLEAGRGGASDEVSLVGADTVAMAPVFEEHRAELGGSLAAIVADKCGVITSTTRAIVTGRQSQLTMNLLEAEVRRRTGSRLAVEHLGVAAKLVGEEAGPGSFGSDAALLPAGLGRDNALLGCHAARRLLLTAGRELPDLARLRAVLRTVQLPGRLSTHRLDRTRLIIDAAVSADGFTAAVGYALASWRRIDHVLLSLPDDKDLDAAIQTFRGLPVTFVALRQPHLRYTRATPPHWTRIDATEVDPALVMRLGGEVLAIGTISFIGQMLGLVGARPAVAFQISTT